MSENRAQISQNLTRVVESFALQRRGNSVRELSYRFCDKYIRFFLRYIDSRSQEGMEEKELTYQLIVRVWGQSHDVVHSHGYLVDDVPTGLSGQVGVLNVNAQKITFKELRPMIEYAQDCGHMRKRSLIFGEALFIFNRMPNLYNRPFGDLQRYRLGFVRKDGSDVKMYKRNQDNTPIVQLLGLTEFFSHDLVIIPFSQIPPEMDEPPEEEEVEEGAGSEAEVKKEEDGDGDKQEGVSSTTDEAGAEAD